jgi:hypothetical protein
MDIMRVEALLSNPNCSKISDMRNVSNHLCVLCQGFELSMLFPTSGGWRIGTVGPIAALMKLSAFFRTRQESKYMSGERPQFSEQIKLFLRSSGYRPVYFFFAVSSTSLFQNMNSASLQDSILLNFKLDDGHFFFVKDLRESAM